MMANANETVAWCALLVKSFLWVFLAFTAAAGCRFANLLRVRFCIPSCATGFIFFFFCSSPSLYGLLISTYVFDEAGVLRLVTESFGIGEMALLLTDTMASYWPASTWEVYLTISGSFVHCAESLYLETWSLLPTMTCADRFSTAGVDWIYSSQEESDM